MKAGFTVKAQSWVSMTLRFVHAALLIWDRRDIFNTDWDTSSSSAAVQKFSKTQDFSCISAQNYWADESLLYVCANRYILDIFSLSYDVHSRLKKHLIQRTFPKFLQHFTSAKLFLPSRGFASSLLSACVNFLSWPRFLTMQQQSYCLWENRKSNSVAEPTSILSSTFIATPSTCITETLFCQWKPLSCKYHLLEL